MDLLVRLLIAAILISLSACAANPVTGKNELSLVSEKTELAVGEKHYAPTRQQQGGDYVIEPELTAYIERVGQRLAKVADRKLPYEFKIINDSTPNAWAMPGGKISINRGLLIEMQSEAELAAVLAHEIVHAAARHGAQSMERDMLIQGALVATSVALADSKYRDIGVLGANIGAQLTQQQYSREAEREADHYGIIYMVRAGYDPNTAVTLQETFVRLAESKQRNWLEGLFASHPPSRERVENNRKQVARLRTKGGEIGHDRYQKMVKRIRRTQPAYEAYEEAEKALDDGDEAKALHLVNKALKIEPKEALFHSLRGDIRQDQKRNKDALTNYNRAMALNPNYFRIPLMRGLLKQTTGDKTGAERDLNRSAKLLPTAEAYLGLGMVAQSRGQNKAAIQHYRKASSSKSTSGKRAAVQLAKLDLERNPSNYIKSGIGLNKSMVVIQVKNTSAVPVRNLRVVLGLKKGFTIADKATYRIRRTLKPGESINIKTDVGPVNAKTARQLSALVEQARIVN